MKRITLAAVTTMAACGLLWAAASLDDLAKQHVKAMQDDSSITNVVNLLVTGGTFCQVRGHKWEHGCGIFGCLVIHSEPMRNCPVCGKVESQTTGPWR